MKTIRSSRARALFLWGLIAWGLVALLLGCGGNSGDPAVVLASGDGITITGSPSAVPPDTTLTAQRISESQAGSAAPLPSNRIFAGAADCGPEGAVCQSPVTLNFILPDLTPQASLKFPIKFSPGWKLLLYALPNNAWESTGLEGVVGADGRTVSVQVSIMSRYVLFLDDNWEMVQFQGMNLVSRKTGIPATDWGNPTVLASGKVDDQGVIDVIKQVIPRFANNPAKLTDFLKSYDTTGSNVIQVLQLTQDVILVRYWERDRGRYFGLSQVGSLLSPDEAIRLYALPDNNNGKNNHLMKLKSGAIIILGIASDRSMDPGFFPTATGGGVQIFCEYATTWVNIPPTPAHAEDNPLYSETIADLRYDKRLIQE